MQRVTRSTKGPYADRGLKLRLNLSLIGYLWFGIIREIDDHFFKGRSPPLESGARGRSNRSESDTSYFCLLLDPLHLGARCSLPSRHFFPGFFGVELELDLPMVLLGHHFSSKGFGRELEGDVQLLGQVEERVASGVL